MFFSLGSFSLNYQFLNKSEVKPLKNDEVIFKIDKKLNSNDKNRKYEALYYNLGEWHRTVMIVPKSHPELDFKHFYQGKGFINQINPPQYRYQFDYQKYMARKDIYNQMYFGEPLKTSIINDVSWFDEVKQYRLQLLQQINATEEIQPKSRELLKGIILADRTDLDDETVMDFNKTGLVHILAISGSHMVIIFWMVFALFSKIIKNKKVVILLSLIFIWLFTILIDFGNSVVRSSIMITMYYIYLLLERKPDLIHSLSLSGLLILIYDPNQIFDVGFQLSYAAVLGIYWLNKPIQNLLPIPRNKISKYFINITSITLSAQISTLPLVIYYFHQFPLISLISNLVAIPIAEIVIIMSLFMVIMYSVGLDFYFVNVIYDLLSNVFLKLVHYFANFESLILKNIPLNIFEFIILVLIIFQLKYLLEKFTIRNRNIILALFLTLYAVKLTFNVFAYQRSELLVHHLYKDKVISFKEKDKITFWIPEDVDYKRVEQFIINPYIVDQRVKKKEIIRVQPNIEEIIIKNTKFSLK